MANPSSTLASPSAATNSSSATSAETDDFFTRVFKNSYTTTTKPGSTACETVYIEDDSLAILPTRIAYVPTWHVFKPDEKDSVPLDNREDYFKIQSAPYAQIPKGLTQGLPELQSGVYTLRLITQGYVYLYDEAENSWAGFKADESANFSQIELSGVKKAVGIKVGRGGNFVSISEAQDSPKIWIGYSRAKWTKKIFDGLVSDSDWRSKVMKPVNAAELGDGSNVEPPASVGFLVDQWAVNLKKYVQEYNRDHKDLTPQCFCYAKTRVSDELEALAALPQQTSNDMNRRNNEDFEAYKGAIAVGLVDAFGVTQDISNWRNYNAGRWNILLNEHSREFSVAMSIASIQQEYLNQGNISDFDDRYGNRFDSSKMYQLSQLYENTLGLLQQEMYYVQYEWAGWVLGDYLVAAANCYDDKDKEAGQALVDDYGDAVEGAGWNPNPKDNPPDTPELFALDKMLDEIDGKYKSLKFAITGKEGAWDTLNDFFSQSGNAGTALGSLDTGAAAYLDISEKVAWLGKFNSFVASNHPVLDMSKGYKTIAALGSRAAHKASGKALHYLLIAAFCANLKLSQVMEDSTFYTKLNGLTPIVYDLQAESKAQAAAEASEQAAKALAGKVSKNLAQIEAMSLIRARAQTDYDKVAQNIDSANRAKQHAAKVRLHNLRVATANLNTAKAALAASLYANDTIAFKIFPFLPQDAAATLTSKFASVLQSLKAQSAIGAGAKIANAAEESSIAAEEASKATVALPKALAQEFSVGNAIGEWFKTSKRDIGLSVVSMFLTLVFMDETCNKLIDANLNSDAKMKQKQIRQMAIAVTGFISTALYLSQGFTAVRTKIATQIGNKAVELSSAQLGKLLGRAGGVFAAVSSSFAAYDNYVEINEQSGKGANTTLLSCSMLLNAVAAVAFIATFFIASPWLLLIGAVATVGALVCAAFYKDTTPLELWVSRCCLGKGAEDYYSYTDADEESRDFIKALNAIVVSFDWNDEWGDDTLTLKVVAPRFIPGRSELAFAINLREDEYSEPKRAYVEYSMVKSADPKLLPAAGDKFEKENVGYLSSDSREDFIRFQDENLVLLPLDGRKDKLASRSQNAAPEFDLTLMVEREDLYSYADLVLQFRPDAISQPDIVVNPVFDRNTDVLRTHD